MRKIIFSLLFLLLFSHIGSAWSDDCERYNTGLPTDTWDLSGSTYGTRTFTTYYFTSIPTTVIKLGAQMQAGKGASTTTITTKEQLDDGYVSLIIRGESGDTTYNSFIITLKDSTGVEITSFTISDTTVNSKYECIADGATVNLYTNGVLTQSNSATWDDSDNAKLSLSVTSTDSSFIHYVYIDDITSSSMIGAIKVFNEGSDTFTYTWSAQLMRSYETQHEITLYSITNPSNTGEVCSWNIPQDDNSTTSEYGYATFSRSGVLGLNYGLYLLEMTRGSTVLADTYIYYDQLADPQGFPEILFLAESDVNAEIRDDSNNGGTISGGGSVYLYPDTLAGGVYNISYDILETPYSIQVELTKIYNTSDLNGTNLLFSGLSSQNYYVSVDGTAINGTNGSDTWNYTVTWDTLNSHIISFAPDYTLPGVYGYIKNSETQNPLKSATVAISNGTFTDYLFTDNNGMYYQTQGIVPGSYNLTASKSGYTTSVPYPVTTQNGSTTRQDIFLDPESGAGVYYASHDVTFTILEYWYSSIGLPGVSYAVYDDENESVKNGTTGSKGTFTVKDMDAGKNYTFILTYNGTTYTEYLEPGLTEYNLVLNKEGIVHQYYNSWLNLTYAETPDNVTVYYSSTKPISEASFVVTSTSNGTSIQDSTKNTTSGTFVFNVTEGDYNLQFDIEASDGSTASQAWSISSPPEVTLFPASYPAWLKNTLFVAIIIIFLLAFGKSKNDIACGSVAVLTSLGYYFEWLTCSFNFVVLIWIIALGAIFLHYKRTGAVG